MYPSKTEAYTRWSVPLGTPHPHCSSSSAVSQKVRVHRFSTSPAVVLFAGPCSPYPAQPRPQRLARLLSLLRRFVHDRSAPVERLQHDRPRRYQLRAFQSLSPTPVGTHTTLWLDCPTCAWASLRSLARFRAAARTFSRPPLPPANEFGTSCPVSRVHSTRVEESPLNPSFSAPWCPLCSWSVAQGCVWPSPSPRFLADVVNGALLLWRKNNASP